VCSSDPGHLGLGRLIVFWDDNRITIDGGTDLSTSEDIGARYQASGWHFVACDGHDPTDIRRAIACGGFPFGDVLGGGRGWAATFRYNARAQTAIRKFVRRQDPFPTGLCQRRQMGARLAPGPRRGARGWWAPVRVRTCTGP